MKRKASRPFNATSRQLLHDPKVAAKYLENILADRNMELFTDALKDVADARLGGVNALSKKTDLNREQLYKNPFQTETRAWILCRKCFTPSAFTCRSRRKHG